MTPGRLWFGFRMPEPRLMRHAPVAPGPFSELCSVKPAHWLSAMQLAQHAASVTLLSCL